MDDDTLVAYADGELDPDMAARVTMLAAADPAIAARIEMFRRTRAALSAHRTPDPLPTALAASLSDRIRAAATTSARAEGLAGASPVAMPAAVPPRRRAMVWPTALAASLALAVGLWSGVQLGNSPAAGTGPAIAGLSNPGLGSALAELASGERRLLGDGSEVAAVASFVDPEGTLCREFEVTGAAGDTLVSVACHDGADWAVRFALAAPASTSGYAPASSIEALEVWIEVVGLGEALSPDDEAGLLERIGR